MKLARTGEAVASGRRILLVSVRDGSAIAANIHQVSGAHAEQVTGGVVARPGRVFRTHKISHLNKPSSTFAYMRLTDL
jgi:hypothetical protein